MSTIYWIEMLNGLVYSIIFIYVALFVASIILIVIADADDNAKLYKYAKTCTLTGIILILLSIFIPTTNQAYRIWGIGGTIEYLKNNKDAKQLPDKTLKILNKLADSYLEEDSTNINK